MDTLRVAQLIEDTEAEGPGRRFAVWVQGCALACPGCCNPEMFDFAAGREVSVEELATRAAARPEIEGLSLLGGEPFAQAAPLASLAERVRALAPRLTLMIYSGHTLAELRAMSDPAVARLLAVADLLVDGRYQHQLPEPRRRWIGSSNQVLHFLSDRYTAEDPRFTSANTVEIRLSPGSLTVNGWPALARRFVPRRPSS